MREPTLRTKIVVFGLFLCLTCFLLYVLNVYASGSLTYIDYQPLPRPQPQPRNRSSSKSSSSSSPPSSSSDCAIYEGDPFDPAYAKYFKYKEYAPPCPKFESPFKTAPPNVFWLDPKYLSKFPRDCSYTVIEGRKKEQEEEEEEEARGRVAVKFDIREKIAVNASFLRIDCVNKTTTQTKSKHETKNSGGGGGGVKSGVKSSVGDKTGDDGALDAMMAKRGRKKRNAKGAKSKNVKSGKSGKSGKPKSGDGETHFVTLPYRPPEMAAVKERAKSRWMPSTPPPLPSSTPPSPPFNVFMIGIDSCSRLNSIRHLSQTRDYLSSKLGAIEFLAYNKVGINTKPNWAAMHTGWPYDETGPFSKKTTPRIWREYADRGFWTIFADDWDLTQWGLDAKGIPFDYRWRVTAKAMLKYNSSMKTTSKYTCIRGKRFGDMMYDWFGNFLDAHRDFPQDQLFSWIWATDWAHGYLNGIRVADVPTMNLFKRLKSKGDLSNSIVMFFSDHGFRFKGFATTTVGYIEGNLPFLFLLFPPAFEKRFPELVANARGNVRRLVTAFDIHRTLQHLLHLQTKTTPWSNNAAEGGARVGYSLMTPVPAERTCNDSMIPQPFCSCHQVREVDPNLSVVRAAATALVDKINAILKSVEDICVVWSLHRVVRARKNPKKDQYSLVVELRPKAEFQGWVEMKKGKATIKMNQISRLDEYGMTSVCVLKRKYDLKEYCRCKVL